MVRATWNRAVIAESGDTIVVDGSENRDAAWCYPHTSAKARRIEGRVAFWKGVKVADDASRRSIRSRIFG